MDNEVARVRVVMARQNQPARFLRGSRVLRIVTKSNIVKGAKGKIGNRNDVPECTEGSNKFTGHPCNCLGIEFGRSGINRVVQSSIDEEGSKFP